MAKREFGTKFKAGRYHGRINPDFDRPAFRSPLASMRELAASPFAEVLLDSRNRVVAMTLPVDPPRRVEVVIKEFRPQGFHRLKTVAVASKERKAWRGAAACLERNIPTPRPLACLARRAAGVVVESYYVSERVFGAREIRYLLREPSSEARRQLLAELAAFLRRAHDRGILHRDLSDGNILVAGGPPPAGTPRPAFIRDDVPGAAFEFTLIDTNRIRVRRRIGWLARVKNLVRLGVPAEEQAFFLDAYLGERRDSALLRSWYKKRKKNYAGYLALKKKLGLRRLAKRLKIS